MSSHSSGERPKRTGTAPTHAGGVVFRRSGGDPEYLLVRARKQPEVWVFPKGHIEAGESAEQAAVREVLEEAGVRAAIVSALDALVLGPQYIAMFLMAHLADGDAPAERERAWLGLDDALRALGFEESRRLLRSADQLAKSIE